VEERYIDVAGRISLFSLSFLVWGFHCARSSILVLGITRYTFLVFPSHSIHVFCTFRTSVWSEGDKSRGKEAYWRKWKIFATCMDKKNSTISFRSVLNIYWWNIPVVIFFCKNFLLFYIVQYWIYILHTYTQAELLTYKKEHFCIANFEHCANSCIKSLAFLIQLFWHLLVFYLSISNNWCQRYHFHALFVH